MASLQDIINHIPVGQSNAMSVADFETAIGNTPSGTNNDQTRAEVSGAIVNHQIPIGSSSRSGYWLIDSDAECNEVLGRIDRTIASYQAKRNAIATGWQIRKASKRTPNHWPK